PKFQFHRGANLLVIIGSRDAVDVARKVVNVLPGQSHLPQPQMSGPSEPGMSPPERAENERFRQRYGLNGLRQGQTIAPNSTDTVEQFRRRYGLDPRPGSEPGAAPAQKPQP